MYGIVLFLSFQNPLTYYEYSDEYKGQMYSMAAEAFCQFKANYWSNLVSVVMGE